MKEKSLENKIIDYYVLKDGKWIKKKVKFSNLFNVYNRGKKE